MNKTSSNKYYDEYVRECSSSYSKGTDIPRSYNKVFDSEKMVRITPNIKMWSERDKHNYSE